MALSDPPPISPARLAEIQRKLYPTDPTYCAEPIDIDEARDLLSVVSSLRQEQERLKAELAETQSAYEEAATFNSQNLDQVQTLTAERDGLKEALTTLIETWRKEAKRDHEIRHDDDSGGIWAYQHEAAGRARKGKQCADELDVALTPPVRSAKEDA